MNEDTIWVCSDHHFNHKNIIGYQENTRGFINSIDEMNELIIDRHNSLVKPNDIVWFLGDIAFGNKNKSIELIKRLNGRKNMVLGNHDHFTRNRAFTELFETIQKYKELKFRDTMIVLFHFPIMYWNRAENGSLHLFGHLHSDVPMTRGRSFEVCIDGNELYPHKLETLVDILTKESILGRSDRENLDRNGLDINEKRKNT